MTQPRMTASSLPGGSTRTDGRRSFFRARSISGLTDQFDQVSDWSEENAPVQNQKGEIKHYLWIPVLVTVTYLSIQALNSVNVCVACMYMVYEGYIIFDHLPFMFTNDLYTSARINYQNLSLSLFWGMEAIASIVASQSIVGAPWLLLANIPNHLFFIVANYLNGVATSKAFLWEKKHESLWLVAGVTMDTSIHMVSLWYYMRYIADSLGGGETLERTTWLWWTLAMVISIFMTCWSHASYMSWEHFALYFGYKPERYARHPRRISQTYTSNKTAMLFTPHEE